jgi:hypothetical protein
MVWGSKTVLEPTLQNRGIVIGIPVALTRFISSPEYRLVIFKLQRQIWNYGAAERLLFFDKDASEVLGICRHRGLGIIRKIVWLFPDASCRDTLLRLHDAGVNLICIGQGQIRGIRDYHSISNVQSIARILRRDLFAHA